MTNRDLLNSILADGRLHFTGDLTDRGVSAVTLRRAATRGDARQIARGLYFSGAIEEPQNLYMAAMSLLADGVVCLSSAAQYHELADEMPGQLWYAVDREKIRATRINRMEQPHQLLYWNTKTLDVGVDTFRIADVDVRITSPARTVIDFLRYRRKLGEEVGPKAMLDYFRQGGSMSDLNEIAEELGAYDDLVPFLRLAEELQQGIPARRP